MPALSADVARAPTSTREAYERKVVALAARMADLLDGRRPDRERRAWSLIALMVGAVSISRAMADPDSQIRAIESARRTAGILVSPEEGTK
jgi:hypothetical protein